MKHRGPGSSLRPSSEAARASSRALTQTMRPGASSVTSAPGVLIGDWWLTTDEHGALVGDHLPTGTRQTLLLPAAPDNERKGTEE